MKARVLVTMLSLLISPLLLAQAAEGSLPSTSTTISEKTPATAVDLNTADAKTLSKAMKGIGIKRAEAIVKFRTEHGNFKSLDDLSGVSGLSKKFVVSHFEQLQQAFVIK